MIGVIVGDDDLSDASGIQTVGRHALEDAVGAGAEARVDESELVATVDQIDVAVESVGQVEPVVAAADQIDVVRQLHRYPSGTE